MRSSDGGVQIHPLASVDESATLGSETRVWQYAVIGAGAVVGARCNIGAHSYVESGVRLGDAVTVKNGVHLWEGVQAEDGVFFGPCCVLTNDLRPRAFLKRPKSVWLTPTVFREGCSIGANATILCGSTIGSYAMVGAGAVVTRDVPDFGVVVGNPARQIGYACKCGSRLPAGLAGGTVHCVDCGSEYALDSGDVPSLKRDLTHELDGVTLL